MHVELSRDDLLRLIYALDTEEERNVPLIKKMERNNESRDIMDAMYAGVKWSKDMRARLAALWESSGKMNLVKEGADEDRGSHEVQAGGSVGGAEQAGMDAE